MNGNRAIGHPLLENGVDHSNKCQYARFPGRTIPTSEVGRVTLKPRPALPHSDLTGYLLLDTSARRPRYAGSVHCNLQPGVFDVDEVR